MLHIRPPFDANDTVQVPSYAAGSAFAAPDRARPAIRHSAATERLICIVDIVVSSGFLAVRRTGLELQNACPARL